MTLPIFPLPIGLGFNVSWSPVFFTQSQTTITGASIDVGLAAYPLYQFELTYDFLRDPAGAPVDSELQTMLGFYLSMGGSRGRFLYTNPDDNTRTGQAIATGQLHETQLRTLQPV